MISVPTLFAGDLPASGMSRQQEAVVLIHGLGRSNTAMSHLAEQLEDAGYQVYRVGYSSFATTPEEMIAEVTRQINDCCDDPERRIHFVGHSLGGLMIRAYLEDYTPQQLGNTVLVGTPNRGTQVADRYQDNCFIKFLMPAALALGTHDLSLPNQLAAPYYPVGVIAGVKQGDNNEDYLPGLDDGLVPVESTKLDGMTDFVQLEIGHSMMRYDAEVAAQIVTFLQQGKFAQKPSTQFQAQLTGKLAP